MRAWNSGTAKYETKQCKVCSEVFTSPLRKHKIICSLNCRNEYSRRRFIATRGIPLSPKLKEKLRHVPHPTGSRSANWRGGIAGTYRQRYPARSAFWSRQRNYRKKNADGSHSLEEWEALKAKFLHRCLCCKRAEPEITLTEDHIIPLSLGGTNWITNIQPLCLSCNSRKNVKATNYIELWTVSTK